MNHSLFELLTVAQTAAHLAGAALQKKWDEPRQRTTKGFNDWVTADDLLSQQIITTYLQEAFPHHAFLTEEESTLPTTGTVRWIIDPIDGTSNYSYHQPTFTISIAAEQAGEIVAGVVYAPRQQEMFAAVTDSLPTLNGRPIQTSTTTTLSESIIAMDLPRSQAGRELGLRQAANLVPAIHSLRMLGSAAMALAWVANGRLDGYAHDTLSAWDAAAGALLVRLAGGVVTNWAGQPWRVGDVGCVAANSHIHPPFYELLQQVRP